MKRFFHLWWQPFAVACFTVFLALQVPRKALFFTPSAEREPSAGVEILAPGGEEYAAMLRRARMTWQVRGRAGPVADSRADVFDFSAPPPPPEYLPPRARAVRPPPPPGKEDAAPEFLAPPSSAEEPDVRPVPPAPADGRDGDLLEIPDSLSGNA